ncbi:putative secreted protein (Por secretion system target) [Lacinutrix venerupis]|uniref:T9SS type A sorting domain-containing protein n=1 Tax=Lacinutrix venerupis TaxID=1486034 RepID=UPI000EAFCEFB|nr:T9SS type A sorting domain-containing protein [Lacinutrix venerupis]RLJ64494.1 putative secreted protein (Por secretion system target) [Lacinutrix venerupis]
MKQFYILTSIFILSFSQIYGQTEWTGPTITVTKTDYADWTLPENQDAITANVILTRADNRGIFNIAQETEFDNNNYTSPIDTEWAIGTIADGVGTLTFDTWDNTHSASPQNIINVDVVLHLITDDIYIDTKITAWTSGGAGGGFTYERSTDPSLSTNKFELDNAFKIYPNPSNDYIYILGLTGIEKYTIYNVLGAKIKKGVISNNEKIDIRDFTNGLYFLKFENGNTIKFLIE